MASYNRGKQSEYVEKFGQSQVLPFISSDKSIITAVRLIVHLRKPLKFKEGQYMYLYFSGMGTRRKFQSHRYVITWWDNSLRATELPFLIRPQHGLSYDSTTRNSIKKVVLDGPYGKDLSLDEYENCILIAKGIGIAGILPYVRHMTYRFDAKDKKHQEYKRGLITHKIDVYWVLEDNFQEEWCSE